MDFGWFDGPRQAAVVLLLFGLTALNARPRVLDLAARVGVSLLLVFFFVLFVKDPMFLKETSSLWGLAYTAYGFWLCWVFVARAAERVAGGYAVYGLPLAAGGAFAALTAFVIDRLGLAGGMHKQGNGLLVFMTALTGVLGFVGGVVGLCVGTEDEVGRGRAPPRPAGRAPVVRVGPAKPSPRPGVPAGTPPTAPPRPRTPAPPPGG